MSGPRTYFAIDLKSYYASAECAARGLDPLTTNLVVADANRLDDQGHISSTGMNSLNHYSYGSVLEWVWCYAAGQQPLAPGFRRARIAPRPDR